MQRRACDASASDSQGSTKPNATTSPAPTELARATTALAARLQSLESVAASTTRQPGSGLSALEEWASQARSALFVARGMLEQERERIVVEANALGSAVLGEQLGGSSASIVRQRLEAELA